VNQDDILDALRAEVPVEIYRRNEYELLREQKRGSCVQATRMGIEALKYFGVAAKPLVTLMGVGNAAWCEWMDAGGPAVSEMPEGAWAVGTDPVEREGERGFPAHLVIEIDGHLLDLDAGFSARPEREIHVPPTLLIPLRDGDIVATTMLEEGGIAFYKAHTPKLNFREMGAWRDSRKWTGPVIRRMRDRLNNPTEEE
jgi:hypothetical protein